MIVGAFAAPPAGRMSFGESQWSTRLPRGRDAASVMDVWPNLGATAGKYQREAALRRGFRALR
jgi:hypothetical protein